MNFWDRSRAPASSLMRRGAVLAILTAALYAGGMPADMVKAGEMQEEREPLSDREEASDTEEEILGDLELEEIQETVDQLLEEDISITEMIRQMMAGERALDQETW